MQELQRQLVASQREVNELRARFAQLEEAQRTVGFRLKVWWDGDRRWYSGRVVKVNANTLQ